MKLLGAVEVVKLLKRLAVLCPLSKDQLLSSQGCFRLAIAQAHARDEHGRRAE